MIVVLAKARTHYPDCELSRLALATSVPHNHVLWLWVLDFARTTLELAP